MVTPTAQAPRLAAPAGGRLAPAGHAPGVEPRLAVSRPQSLAEERARGAYTPLPPGLDLIGELEAAGLRGRGGAGFPAHIKWRAVAEAAGPRVVVANGEEGEPSSVKDRWLLSNRPHLVLDGLLLAAGAVGADRAVVYLSDPATADAVRAAVAEAPVPAGLRIEVHLVDPAYVAGEESAACRAISGGPALPLAKPPRVSESGVDGLPTLVSNVETLAHASWIARHGATAYRAHGTARSPGTTLVTLTGACARPGVYEVPFGMPMRELLTLAGGTPGGTPAGYLVGGWFGGVLGPGHAGVSCCYEGLRDAGSGLGCGAITVLAPGDDPVAVAAEITAWYARESAGQCGVCVRGTASIRDAFAALADGRAAAFDAATPAAATLGRAPTDDAAAREQVAKLRRWGATLPGRGACAFLDGAATWARTVTTEFADRLPGTGPDPQNPTPQNPDPRSGENR